MSGQIPAGWYPDPSDPSRARWWDGAAWAEPSPHAPAVPAAPSAPAGYAPGGYAAASAYTPAPPVPQAPLQTGIATHTVWIWLAIVASTLPLFSVFLLDWDTYLQVAMADAAGRDVDAAQVAPFVVQSLVLGVAGWGLFAASIVFSWLDWRELGRRGVVRPFHWAWSFFVLSQVTLLGVYVIGRSVVLKRRTGDGGWAALWVWIGVTVVGFVVLTIWTVQFVSVVLQELLATLPTT
ncbi:DUF2510 domain-containing protein [Microbacterium sp.]|uniref:DUF2510 domain-containing protein n=1 Tax=Microbacterium sp. TaxID=51671 RepID=UPI0039E397A0